ncbi:MAG TPA: hypothetical protein PLU73_02235 [Bacteroidia bacterium]|nr:hypothetical protein [Bacteroidia bacterium]
MKTTKNKSVLFALMALLFIASCKKKDDPEPTPEPEPTPAPAPVQTFNGWARAYNEYSYLIGQANDVYALSFARIFFTTNNLTSTAAGTTYSYTFGGMVIVNNNLDTLQYNSGTYEKNLAASLYTVPVSWKIAGSGSVPSFSTSCSQTFPSFTGFNSFPATLSKNAGITYTITGFTNTDRVIVALSDGNGSYLYQHEATLSGTTATVNFPASETANFANGVNGYIDIYFYNDEVKTVNNFALKYSNVRREFVNGFTITN